MKAAGGSPAVFLFLPWGATVANEQWEVTTIVVVVIYMFIYDYYLTGHSEMGDGLLECCNVLSASSSRRRWRERAGHRLRPHRFAETW